MYERLTDAAQSAVRRATRLAQDSGQEYVGTEHILIAIASEESDPTSRLLADCGLDSDALEAEVRGLIENQLSESLVLGHLPSTPHLQNVLARAIERARELRHKQVGTEHLLLAVLDEAGSVAQAALEQLGVDLNRLKKELLS